MNDLDRLENLLKDADKNDGDFARVKQGQVGRGTIPIHYKRLSIDAERAHKLSTRGAALLWMYYGERVYYTQALIAGAILSGEFDKFFIVTPSQYGKSWLIGHIALLLAYNGHTVNVAASGIDGTSKIMSYVAGAASHSVREIKEALTGDTLKKIDRLDQSLSKAKISFAIGGSVEAFTLGDTYNDLRHNHAVGHGGAYIVDEAALVTSDALAEIGRHEYSTTDGTREPLIMISNPHMPGTFYDCLTEENPDERTLIIWSDILTACQEGRWTPEHVLKTDFAKHSDTLQRYLLCELPGAGSGMFGDVVVSSKPAAGIHVLGVDAAYRGKDAIEVSDVVLTGNGIHFAAVEAINKPVWIDGVTSKEIIEQIARTYHTIGAAMVCVDIGFGVWLVEGLASRGVNVRGVNFGGGPSRDRIKARHYAALNASNMRAEMHLDLQDLTDNKKCTFAPSVYEQIKEVLPLVTAERKTSGKIAVRPKIEIKNAIGHSPDAFDAVLLGLHAAVLYSQEDVAFMP